MSERIDDRRLRELNRLTLPDWADEKLPKPLRRDWLAWNDSLGSVDRASRTAVLRCRIELRSLLSALVPLSSQWSEAALAAALGRAEESLEMLLPRGVVEPSDERLYDRSLLPRVNADPLVRVARAHENEARRFSSDLSGLAEFNRRAIQQLEGSTEPEGRGWYQPNPSSPLFGSRKAGHTRVSEPAELVGQSLASVQTQTAGEFADSFDTAAEPL